ncbi:hypothetical protein O181_008632 [Austropuccinia psidii MF-1]|uniref:Uncharacterized protein n=1 Tax=Austropuccinia psidii MF-1 TaxID=1389203 RepID=A0A9Q3BQ48_9BASI|nr:hypothetical protein [Austropuccinia psidii MF-1]
MQEMHGRRSWSWWKSQIIQKYSNGTWIWQKTISFENDKYSVDKDPYEWYLRQSKRCKGIDPQMNIWMRNHNLLTQIPGELEHAVKCRCNQSRTPDDIEKTLQDLRKRTNIGKYTQFKITDHYANNCPKAKKEVYAIGQVPEEESPKEDSEPDFMGDAIREQSDDDPNLKEEISVEYQEETQLEIQDIKLEWCTLLNSGQRISGQPYPKLGKQLLPTKAKRFKSESGKMTSTGTIFKEIGIPHGKGNIRLNPEFVLIEDAHIQGFLLGTDYQRTYDIDIYNSKNRHITIGTNKEKKFSLYIYQMSTHDPLEELLNEFREGRFSTRLTSKKNLVY